MTFAKRKQFWVDAPLQLQMLGYVLALIAASLLLLSFSVFSGLNAASSQSHQVFHSMEWVRDALRGPMTIAALLSILAAGLLTLIWSHRFAGPLRVLSAAMDRLRHGNFTQHARVRDTDTLQDVVREFTQMQDGLRLILSEQRAKALAAAVRLESLAREAGSEAERRELHQLAADLKAIQHKLHL